MQCSKQAQLEAMASEKQAAQLQVEKQAREIKEAKVQGRAQPAPPALGI